MDNDYLKTEINRLLMVLAGGLLLGYVTSYYLPSLLLAFIAYAIWQLYKLHQLQQWLQHGLMPEQLPDSDGLWEQVTHSIYRFKQKYEARKEQQQLLVNRFDTILSVLPDAKILLTADHLIQWSNRAAKELLGIDEIEDHGQRIDNLIRVRKLTKLLTKADIEKEIRFQSPLDERLTFSARLFPVQNGMMLLSVRDVSLREQLNHTRRTFIANASHELRTPLTVISGYLELFDEDPDLPDYLKPAISQSREQAFRMQQIIADMLTLSRLENSENNEATPKSQIDIASLIRNTVEGLKKTIASDNEHQFSLALDEDIQFLGNPKDITSVINNLIENAVKHTPAGTHIHISWQEDNSNQRCFSVEDDGPGIPAEHIEHLTERFFRVDKGRSRDMGGTGLGLAIVKHAILNHQGKLNINSQPGRTVFKACFPAHEENA